MPLGLGSSHESVVHGKYVLSFRPSPWVQRLLARADEIREFTEAKPKADEIAKAKEEAALFQEIDF